MKLIYLTRRITNEVVDTTLNQIREELKVDILKANDKQILLTQMLYFLRTPQHFF
jgi:hypothetical protein